MNDSITPSDDNTWHWIRDYHWWVQNNLDKQAHMAGMKFVLNIEFLDTYDLKDLTYHNFSNGDRLIYLFRPIIEYRE